MNLLCRSTRNQHLGTFEDAKRILLVTLTTVLSTSTVSADLVYPGEVLVLPTDNPWSGPVKNNGTIVGTTDEGEYLTFSGDVSGAGSYAGNVEFVGNFSPGNSPAVVSFEGDLNFGPSNKLTVELGGMLTGEFDRLEVSGNVQLNGILDVQLINQFVPRKGDSFEIIDVGGLLSGQFNGLDEGSLLGHFAGTDLIISYVGGDGNDVVLSATAIPEPSWVGVLGVILASVWGKRTDHAAGDSRLGPW